LFKKKFTGEMGFLSYYEVCENLAKNNWTYVFNVEQQTPFAYFGNQWVGFDDVISLKKKTQFLIDNNLGGAMIWVNLKISQIYQNILVIQSNVDIAYMNFRYAISIIALYQS